MRNDNGLPAIEDSAQGLGVRGSDIPADDSGLVAPGTGGMSVSPSWRQLPGHRVPQRLRAKLAAARGKDHLACFRLGDGAFEDGPLAERLTLRRDPKDSSRHGFVEPDLRMPTAAYREALAATRPMWILDEE